jgi:hypothetical protein
MKTISPFDGSIPRKNKTLPTQPEFAGPLSIGAGLYNCSVWKNQTKKGRPYLVLRLSKQGFGKDQLEVALWERPKDGGFGARLDLAGNNYRFGAKLIQGGHRLELSMQPASAPGNEKLRLALERLPIPVLWQALGLAGTVRPKCCVRSPLRDDDRNPSLSIYDNGRRFKDHGTGVRGDAFDFFKLITKLDSKTAFSRFLELASIAPDT